MALVRIGGEADKLGNHYEALWRLKLLLDLIAGDTETLVLEGFDRSRTNGVDAEVTRLKQGRLITEFHSVKRQNTEGIWKPGRMVNQGDRSPLPPLITKMMGEAEGARGIFVSTDHVEFLPGLADAAVRSSTVQVLMDRFRCGSRNDQVELAGLFRDLVRWLSLTEEQCLQVLKGLRFRAILEPDLEEDVARTIRKEVMRLDSADVDEAAVANHLADFMRLHLGGPIGRAQVLDFLRALQPGYCEKNLSSVPSALAQIGSQNCRFVREAEPRLVQGRRIPRAETNVVLGHLTAPSRQWVMLTGNAGSGKSCVLAQVVDNLKDRRIPCFAFRFDTATPVDSIAKLKDCLDVKWEPVGLLDNVAKRGQSVLIIDQVDALSDVAGRRNGQQWQVLYRLIEEARECPNMSILLACRSFDLENDAELKALLKREKEKSHWPDAKKVDVGPLPHDVVKQCLKSEGIETGDWTVAQLDVLAIPLHLELFLQCKETDSSPVASLSALYERYLTKLRSEAIRAVPPWDLDASIAPIVECFSDYQAVAVEWKTIEGKGLRSQAAQMISCGVLSDQGLGSQRLVRFFHDTLFDHAFGRFFLQSGESLIGMLTKPGERQELFRRTHCRQVLTFLRNGSPHEVIRYRDELKSLLTSPEIRIHLKLFILVWLNALTDPTIEEWRIVQKTANTPPRAVLGKSQRQGWWQFVMRLATWSRVPWFDLLHREGLWRSWLDGKDTAWGGQLPWMLGQEGIMMARGTEVMNILRSTPGENSRLRRRRAVALLSWGEFYRGESAAMLFAEAFTQNWPGLNEGGNWQYNLKLLPQGSKAAAKRVLECIILNRLRLKKRNGRLAYESKPRNWRQRVKEKWDEWRENRKWSRFRTQPVTWSGKVRQRLGILIGRVKNGAIWIQTKRAGEILSHNQAFEALKTKVLGWLFPPINIHRLDGNRLAEFLLACADYIPVELCDTTVQYLERMRKEQGDRIGDTITHLWTGYNHLDTEPCGALISALRQALTRMAETKPVEAEPFIKRLLGLSIPGLDRMVMQIWAANPQWFAQRVAPFFREDPQRLFAQPSMWSGGNAMSFYARTLLQATAPHLPDSDFAEIEKMILHTTDHEMDPQKIVKRFVERHGHPPDKRNSEDRAQLLNWLKWKDSGKHTLLSVLPATRLSIAGRRKLTVWEARYGTADLSPPGGIESHFVGAPIENDQLAKMNDAQVFQAMRSYPSTRRSNTPLEWSQDALVRQFRRMATSQKRRFLALVRQFPPDIESSYQHAIIEGLLSHDHEGFTALPDNELSIDETTELITSAAQTPDDSLAKAICWNLRRPNEVFPRPWLSILLDLALHHADPATIEDDQSIRTVNGGERALGHDLMTNGINHVRGAACNAIAKALFDDTSVAEVVRPEIPKLIEDKSLGVRASLIELLIAWLNIDRDEAVGWFIQMAGGNDSLLHCPLAEHFLGYACHTHLSQLGPLIDRMTNGMSGEARSFGVRQTTRAAFIDNQWKPKVERLLTHRDPEVRKGVADTAASHWPFPRHREKSEQWLRIAFDDQAPAVCECAAHVFRQVPDNDWALCSDLIRAFADSPALLRAPETLIWRIDEAKPVPVDLITYIVGRVMAQWKRHKNGSKKLEKLRWGSHGLPKLILRAYHNTIEPQQKVDCLDLFDDMLMQGFFGIKELVQGSE